MTEKDTNVTATVPKAVRERLEIKAAMLGVSLSRYAAGLLTDAVVDAPEEASAIYVRAARDEHGSLAVTIPPEIAAHMMLEPKRPIAFAAVPGGALVRSVR